MAGLVTGVERDPAISRRSCDLWPIDHLALASLAASAMTVAVWSRRIPQAWWLLALHLAGAALILAAARRQSDKLTWVFRHWYPVAFVVACYKELSILIPAIRGVDYDREMARLDHALWGVHPTLFLERFHAPWLTDFLQLAYSLFIPALLLGALMLWNRRQAAECRYYIFLVVLGFLVSYVGYFLVPVRGPRFYLRDLQHVRLHGLWLFQPLQAALDWLEAAHYDCFPSGHVELTILAWWGSRRISPVLFGVFLPYTLCIVFATVYLRYHYTVDVIAGVLVAAALLVVAPPLYAKLRRGC